MMSNVEIYCAVLFRIWMYLLIGILIVRYPVKKLVDFLASGGLEAVTKKIKKDPK